MNQLAMFEGIKERVRCPKCGSANAQWRRKLANWRCLRCGTVWDEKGPAKASAAGGAR
jgi:rubredoxin